MTLRTQPRRPVTRLASLLDVAGWTFAEAAHYADVSESALRRVYRAESHEDLAEVPLRVLVSIAKAFKVSPSDLYPRLSQRRAREAA